MSEFFYLAHFMIILILTNTTFIVFQWLVATARVSHFRLLFHYLYYMFWPYTAILRYILCVSCFTASIPDWGTHILIKLKLN
jgi:hypothetical protein